MKRLTIAALLAAQMVVASPVSAAELADVRDTQAAAFGGVRVQLPLDASAGNRRFRAGLTLAPAIHSHDGAGWMRTRIGEGVELGVVGNGPLRLSVAGTPVSRIVQGGAAPEGPRSGISTIAWVGIGVGVVLVAGTLVFVHLMNESSE